MAEETLKIRLDEPAGFFTPEGKERIAVALEKFNDLTAEVANLAETFIDNYEVELNVMHDIGGQEEEYRDDLLELTFTITARKNAQEELLRAVAGAAPMPPESEVQP